MSILSSDLLEREALLSEFFNKYPGVTRAMADTMAQDFNAKYLTPIIDEGQWSVMYNDQELLSMIDQGLFPVVDQLKQESYDAGFKAGSEETYPGEEGLEVLNQYE